MTSSAPESPTSRRPRRPRPRRDETTPAAVPLGEHPATTPRPRTAPTFGAVAWLVILAAVAVVQLTRDAWTDSAVLVAVLVALVADLGGRLPRVTVEVSSQGWVVVAAAALLGLLLVVAPRHGAVAGFAVCAAGAGALVYAWPDRVDDDPPVWDRPTSRTAFAWAAAWVAGCLWELAMFLLGGTVGDGRDVYPAASDLLDPLLDNPLLKALFVLVWLSAGVGLLARTDRR